jgi:hypothetical protein
MIYGTPPIVTNGLVLSLDASNTLSYPRTGTTWKDLSGNNNNGTLTNGPTFSNDGGGSIVFDGVNDYVNVFTNSNIPLSNSQYSITVWFNANVFGGGGLVGWGAYGITNGVNAFRFNGNGFRHYWWGNDLDVGLNMSTGVWYNATALYNGINRQIWLNTSLIIQDTPVGHNVPYATNLAIGSTNNLTEFFNGRLGLVQIYNKGLSSQEISQNYNALKTRFRL